MAKASSRSSVGFDDGKALAAAPAQGDAIFGCDQRPAVGGVGRAQGFREQVVARRAASGTSPSTVDGGARDAQMAVEEAPERGLRVAVHRIGLVVAGAADGRPALLVEIRVEAGQHDGAFGKARDGAP